MKYILVFALAFFLGRCEHACERSYAEGSHIVVEGGQPLKR